jgi:hypothetical protein
MGRDIHAIVESTEAGIDGFLHRADLVLDRHYRIFGLMAGARTQGALFEPRGFPSDADDKTCIIFEEWGGQAHTPSWLGTDEFAAVLDAFAQNYPTWVIPPIYTATLAFMRALGDSARIVFWFDN